MNEAKLLRRYTSLPIALDMLWNKRITLVDPNLWVDQNDAFFIHTYKKRKNLKSVLALCFTMKSERYHHWNVFAPGYSGVRLELDFDEIISPLKGNPSINHGKVEYNPIKNLQGKLSAIDINKLPFLKRTPYKDEEEYRLIYESNEEDINTKSFPLKLAAVKRIILSPFLPKPLDRTIKDIIKSIPDCSDIIDVWRTTLIDNPEWKGLAEKVPARNKITES